jgi:hypothetical protein
MKNFLMGAALMLMVLSLAGFQSRPVTLNGKALTDLRLGPGLTSSCDFTGNCTIFAQQPTINKKPFSALETGPGLMATCNDLGSCYMRYQEPGNENRK